MPPKRPEPHSRMNVDAFLKASGISRRLVRTSPGGVVFVQGDEAPSVYYLQEGRIKLSVLSKRGKEAVVAMLSEGDFFGEGCLAGQSRRMCTATALVQTTLLRIRKVEMVRALHEHTAFAERFIEHMLTRNIRFQEDLVDQLFNSSERRLARTLLLLAQYTGSGVPERVLPKLSQETLAEMVGTTRSRVNLFMNKFRKLGFVDYAGGAVKINPSLLSVVLHD